MNAIYASYKYSREVLRPSEMPRKGSETHVLGNPDLPLEIFRKESWGNAYVKVFELIGHRSHLQQLT